MDYDKLSDRELDALVAERVMGWAHLGAGRLVGPYLEPEEWQCPNGERSALPDFAEAIADAWLVVEKMLEAGWVLDSMDSLGREGSEWRVHFARFAGHDDTLRVATGTAEEASISRALCIAALRALEE